MVIELGRGDCEDFDVDRDSTLIQECHMRPGEEPHEGFDIMLGDAHIHFVSEVDAVRVAKAILKRMGE